MKGIMTKEQALSLLKQVCEQYKGTLQEHQLLQEALKIVSDPEKVEVKKE